MIWPVFRHTYLAVTALPMIRMPPGYWHAAGEGISAQPWGGRRCPLLAALRPERHPALSDPFRLFRLIRKRNLRVSMPLHWNAEHISFQSVRLRHAHRCRPAAVAVFGEGTKVRPPCGPVYCIPAHKRLLLVLVVFIFVSQLCLPHVINKRHHASHFCFTHRCFFRSFWEELWIRRYLHWQ